MPDGKHIYKQTEYIYSRGRRIPLSSLRMRRSRIHLDGVVQHRPRSVQKISPLVRSERLVREYIWKFGMLRARARVWRDQQDFQSMWARLSPVRAWQYSLVGMLVLGVVGTSFIYTSFGKNALADDADKDSGIFVVYNTPRVLGVEKTATGTKHSQEQFESRVRARVEGYPIEDMLPYIFKYDQETAAFLVAIARKESAWGKRVPVYYGENCFNYWGYRGQDEIMGSAGHTCFDTPKEAVITVGNRLQRLIDDGRDTASKLIVWKCGYSCEGHSSASVDKWISDVDGYYRYSME